MNCSPAAQNVELGTRVKMAIAVLVATAMMVEGWALRERVRAAALTTRAAVARARAVEGTAVEARAVAAVMDAESRVVGVTVAEMREKVGMVTVVMVAVVMVAGVTARVTAGTAGVMLAETMVHSRNSRPRQQTRRR